MFVAKFPFITDYRSLGSKSREGACSNTEYFRVIIPMLPFSTGFLFNPSSTKAEISRVQESIFLNS